MLRECAPGSPSNEASFVDRPSCSECNGVGGVPPFAIAIWLAMTWSTEIALVLFIGPLALTPVNAAAQLSPVFEMPAANLGPMNDRASHARRCRKGSYQQ